MRKLFFVFGFFASLSIFGQVGIGTTNPEGALDVTTTNDLGFVLPRVSSVANVTDGNGGSPVNGTMVFDISKAMPCVYTDGKWVCFGFDSGGSVTIVDGTPTAFSTVQLYFKASNTDAGDQFGNNVVLSDDGLTMAIAAPREESLSDGVNGNQLDNSAANVGAVFLFVNNSGTWSQEAYIKSSNSDDGDFFGRSISLSADGNVLVVGAPQEDSAATTINGNQNDNSATGAGAVYVFQRSGTTWSQTAYLKPSNAQAADNFGQNVSVSDDGLTVAVASPREDSGATGINGNSFDNSRSDAGAAYVFVNSGGVWSQEAYVKASNTEAGDSFGTDLSLDGSGDLLVVSATGEDGNSNGLGGNQFDNSASGSGAVYVFRRSGVWSQEVYIKASNTDAGDEFGANVAVSQDGSTIAVAAWAEDSNATGINGNQTDNSNTSSGAVYVFSYSGVWGQEAYVKASNSDPLDYFGYGGISLSADGSRLAVGGYGEDSNAVAIDGNATDNSVNQAGAVHVFNKVASTWNIGPYVKSLNTGIGDWFGGYNLSGYNVISLSADGTLLAVGATSEDSSATGIGGDQTDNSFSAAGAVYLYED